MAFYDATPTRFELWGAVVVIAIAAFAVAGTNRDRDHELIVIQRTELSNQARQLENQVRHLENQRLQLESINAIGKRLESFSVNQTMNVDRPRTNEENARDILRKQGKID